jgi:hypothetical protein
MKTKTLCTLLVALAVPLTHCQKAALEQKTPEDRPSAPARAPVLEREPAAVKAPERAAGPDAGLGRWVESPSFKFKVTSVATCADVDIGRDEGKDAAAPAIPEDRPVRVGVTVHVLSTYDGLFVSGRDVSFEKDGVIVRSEIDARPSAGCIGLLESTTLKHDETASGVVIFQLPDQAFARTGTIAFQPTRWGGAPRLEVRAGELASLPGARKAARR